VRRCDGADLVNLLAASTQFYQPRGLRSSRQVDSKTLISMLRAAFRPADIEKDELFWKMKTWERANHRYPLLKRWRDLDPLGVLSDQRYWESDLHAILKTLEPGAMLAVFKMDLDNFKAVNDKYGHTVGDEAIRLYSRTVLDIIGAVGEVYRRGGDEIIVLAPGLSEGGARELAEKTRGAIEARFRSWARTGGLDYRPTASIGLTLAAADRPASEILRLVDDAQRRAKELGKNRVVVMNE